MNSLVIIRPNRRQPRRAWGDRVYVPTLPVQPPLDAPDSRPEPKVSESILRQLQAPSTKVIHFCALPYGWQDNPEYANSHVYVGRACPALNSDGYFGNPFHVGKAYPAFGLVTPATGADVVRLYEREFLARLLHNADFAAKLRALAGKTLVCHCKAYSRPGESKVRGMDNPCHADILARYADRLALLQ